jgi:hypothetical protein
MGSMTAPNRKDTLLHRMNPRFRPSVRREDRKSKRFVVYSLCTTNLRSGKQIADANSAKGLCQNKLR